MGRGRAHRVRQPSDALPRLCAGLSGSHIIHTAIRILLWLLLWFALIMLSWRCLCPWTATWMPA